MNLNVYLLCIYQCYASINVKPEERDPGHSGAFDFFPYPSGNWALGPRVGTFDFVCMEERNQITSWQWGNLEIKHGRLVLEISTCFQGVKQLPFTWNTSPYAFPQTIKRWNSNIFIYRQQEIMSFSFFHGHATALGQRRDFDRNLPFSRALRWGY